MIVDFRNSFVYYYAMLMVSLYKIGVKIEGTNVCTPILALSSSIKTVVS
jgi:hypothetical protein